METDFQRRRRQRAERRAAKLRRQSDVQHEAARAEVEHIPMGQPILVGHHSERKHRKALERHDRKMRSAVDTSRAAEQADARARAAGRSISSDDPDAIEALRAKLAELEEERETSKRINRLWRKGGADALVEAGFNEKLVAKLAHTMGLCPWMKSPMDTKNLGANIRRVRARIEELEAAAERVAAPDIVGDGFRIEECPEDNRIRFHFDARPDRDVIQKMKRAGFKWSRANGAWQRHLNNGGRYACERMARELFGWEPDAAAADDDADPDPAPSNLLRTILSFNRHLMARRLRGAEVTAPIRQRAMRIAAEEARVG